MQKEFSSCPGLAQKAAHCPRLLLLQFARALDIHRLVLQVSRNLVVATAEATQNPHHHDLAHQVHLLRRGQLQDSMRHPRRVESVRGARAIGANQLPAKRRLGSAMSQLVEPGHWRSQLEREDSRLRGCA